MDRDKRLLSTIVIDGKDINLAMIEVGLAEVYQGPESGNPYKPQYQAAEEATRAAKKGEKYESPRAHRKRVGISQPASERIETGMLMIPRDPKPPTSHTSIRMDARLDTRVRAKVDELANHFQKPRDGRMSHHAMGSDPGTGRITRRWGVRSPCAPPVLLFLVGTPSAGAEDWDRCRHARGALAARDDASDDHRRFSGQLAG